MTPRSPRLLLAVAVLAAPALAACGDDDGGGAEIPEGAVEVHGVDSLRFEPDELTVPAGEATFALVDDGSIPHTFLVEGLEDELKLSVAGVDDVDSGSITLEAGDYVFYCDVPGHRAAGMEGTLTVG